MTSDVSETRLPRARLLPSRGRLTARRMPVVVLALVIGVLTFSPVIAMFYNAVHSTVPVGGGFTAAAIESVYGSPRVWKSLGVTLEISVAAALFGTVVGAVFAWFLARTDVRGKGVFEIFVLAPLFTSPLVAAIEWFGLAAPESGYLNRIIGQITGHQMSLFDVTNIYGITWVLGLHSMPYAYLFIKSALRNMDPALEEASHANGHGPVSTLIRVTLPMTMPAVAASLMFIVVLSAGVFSVPSVLGPRLSTVPLPVLIYQAMTQYIADYPRMAALGTMLFILSGVLLFGYRRLTRVERRYATVTGKGFRPRQIRLGRLGPVATGVGVVYAVACVILPNAALVLAAVTRFASRDLVHMPFTWENVTSVVHRATVQSALTNTLVSVVAVVVVVGVLAGLSALLMRRASRSLNAGLDYANSAPLAIPGIVLSAGLLLVYLRTPLYATLALLMVAYVIHCLPNAFRIIRTGSMQISSELDEASAVNGVGRLGTIRRVTLPLIAPSVFGALALVAILTIRDVNEIILLYSPDSQVLSVLTWSYMADGSVSSAAVIGVIQSLMILVILIIGRLAFGVNALAGDRR